jgi:hypothetical protein
MIREIIRTFHDQRDATTRDAGIVLPGEIMSMRQINLPYMKAAELARELY